MKVMVIGASGKTGHLVVEKAVAAGHIVTALVHQKPNPKDSKDEPRFPVQVEVFYGDVQNPTTLRHAMEGCQAVIETIGSSKPFVETHLEESAAKVVLQVMHELGVRRLVVTSVLGAGDSKSQTSFSYEHLVMPLFLRGTMKDKNAMEAEVSHSDLEWILVRPPFLSDSEPTGTVHVVPDGETAHKITRGDLAQFLVDQLTSDTHLRQTVTVANK